MKSFAFIDIYGDVYRSGPIDLFLYEQYGTINYAKAIEDNGYEAHIFGVENPGIFVEHRPILESVDMVVTVPPADNIDINGQRFYDYIREVNPDALYIIIPMCLMEHLSQITQPTRMDEFHFEQCDGIIDFTGSETLARWTRTVSEKPVLSLVPPITWEYLDVEGTLASHMFYRNGYDAFMIPVLERLSESWILGSYFDPFPDTRDNVLFAMVARDLGYPLLAVDTGFPNLERQRFYEDLGIDFIPRLPHLEWAHVMRLVKGCINGHRHFGFGRVIPPVLHGGGLCLGSSTAFQMCFFPKLVFNFNPTDLDAFATFLNKIKDSYNVWKGGVWDEAVLRLMQNHSTAKKRVGDFLEEVYDYRC